LKVIEKDFGTLDKMTENYSKHAVSLFALMGMAGIENGSLKITQTAC
jgi:hypothetical protein